jgi:hypothetical protein
MKLLYLRTSTVRITYPYSPVIASLMMRYKAWKRHRAMVKFFREHPDFRLDETGLFPEEEKAPSHQ